MLLGGKNEWKKNIVHVRKPRVNEKKYMVFWQFLSRFIFKSYNLNGRSDKQLN